MRRKLQSKLRENIFLPGSMRLLVLSYYVVTLSGFYYASKRRFNSSLKMLSDLSVDCKNMYDGISYHSCYMVLVDETCRKRGAIAFQMYKDSSLLGKTKFCNFTNYKML